jgi:putative transposase
MLSYKYRIYPNREQIDILREHLDICRWTYNTLLDYCYAERKAGRITPTSYSLGYLLSSMKKQTPSLKMVHSLVLTNVAERVRSGFENFWSRKAHGLKAGFPHFRKKGDYNSLTYRQSGYKIAGNDLTLSKLGIIKINLHRLIEGKIKRVTIIEDGERWFVSFSCETVDKPIPDRQKIVGLDMGLISLVATSDGDLIEPPKTYKNSERRLKRLGRQLSKKKLRSKNWYKSKARLSKLHRKVANQRKDFIYNLSRNIVNKYEVVAIEDLKISNMQKNHKLAKSIGDAGWGEIKRTLGYMSKMSGGNVILVNPNGTSQTCPNCGGEVHKTLSDRVHNCPKCGLVIDRDIASAMEIRNRGQIILERDRIAQIRIHACGDNGNADLAKAEQRPVSLNQEPLTSNREGLYIAPNEKLTFTTTIPTGAGK